MNFSSCEIAVWKIPVLGWRSFRPCGLRNAGSLYRASASAYVCCSVHGRANSANLLDSLGSGYNGPPRCGRAFFVFGMRNMQTPRIKYASVEANSARVLLSQLVHQKIPAYMKNMLKRYSVFLWKSARILASNEENLIPLDRMKISSMLIYLYRVMRNSLQRVTLIISFSIFFHYLCMRSFVKNYNRNILWSSMLILNHTIWNII